jgi:hypothetical protein
MPARIISLWLTISASAGASLRVPIKKREAFMRTVPNTAQAGRPKKFQGEKAARGERRWRRRLSRQIRDTSAGKPARIRSVTVRSARYLFIIKAILKDSKVVVCSIVKAFARTSASSS